jgi:hypothetical protein
MPDDFVIFCSERKSIFRFKKRRDGFWDKMIRANFEWTNFDNVGQDSAEEAFTNVFNEVFAFVSK